MANEAPQQLEPKIIGISELQSMTVDARHEHSEFVDLLTKRIHERRLTHADATDNL